MRVPVLISILPFGGARRAKFEGLYQSDDKWGWKVDILVDARLAVRRLQRALIHEIGHLLWDLLLVDDRGKASDQEEAFCSDLERFVLRRLDRRGKGLRRRDLGAGSRSRPKA